MHKYGTSFETPRLNHKVVQPLKVISARLPLLRCRRLPLRWRCRRSSFLTYSFAERQRLTYSSAAAKLDKKRTSRNSRSTLFFWRERPISIRFWRSGRNGARSWPTRIFWFLSLSFRTSFVSKLASLTVLLSTTLKSYSLSTSCSSWTASIDLFGFGYVAAFKYLVLSRAYQQFISSRPGRRLSLPQSHNL